MRRPSEACHYTVLGLSHSASSSEVKSAFRKLALINHPDKLANHSDAEKIAGEEQMKIINNAHDVLGDPDTRAEYDASQSDARTPTKRPRRSTPKAPKKRKREFQAGGDSDDYPRKRRSARPKARQRKKREGNPTTSQQRRQNTYTHYGNGWGLSATISSKHHMLDEVEDVTTAKMHHICISLALHLKINEDYEAPKDGIKDYDISFDISSTPEDRDITSITTVLKETDLQHPQGRDCRTLIVIIVSLRTAGPIQLPLHAFFDFEAPIRPPLQARACATNLIFSRGEPSQQIREFEPTPLYPVFPRACPESHILTIPELKTKGCQIRWVDLKSSGEKYQVKECNGDKWYRMAAVKAQRHYNNCRISARLRKGIITLKRPIMKLR